MLESLALALDIGGTKIEAALVAKNGHAQKRLRLPTPKSSINFKQTVLQLISDLSQNKTIKGVGFSIPGSIDPQTKKLRNAPNSPEINNSKLLWNLQKEIPFPCYFENDANCLVLSESLFGVAKGKANILGLIMGTGFGGGVLLNHQLFPSLTGLAPELGHTILNVEGRPCLCGNTGCVEAYLSGPSILKRYHEKGGDPLVQKTEDLFIHQKKDPIALEIIDETKMFFIRLIASLVSTYDPEMIVLGGGLSRQKLYYGLEPLIAKHVFGKKICPPINKAAKGDSSGLYGAASLVFNSKLEPRQGRNKPR